MSIIMKYIHDSRTFLPVKYIGIILNIKRSASAKARISGEKLILGILSVYIGFDILRLISRFIINKNKVVIKVVIIQ